MAEPTPRETLGFEVVVRFFPGSEREAFAFATGLDLPEQARWIRLDRIVAPEGEERLVELSRGRSGGCDNCGAPFSEHCSIHLIPCCPGKCPGRKEHHG